VEQPLPCHLGPEFCLEDLGPGSDRQVEGIAGGQPHNRLYSTPTGHAITDEITIGNTHVVHFTPHTEANNLYSFRCNGESVGYSYNLEDSIICHNSVWLEL
jgi:hypothetical protein